MHPSIPCTHKRTSSATSHDRHVAPTFIASPPAIDAATGDPRLCADQCRHGASHHCTSRGSCHQQGVGPLCHYAVRVDDYPARRACHLRVHVPFNELGAWPQSDRTANRSRITSPCVRMARCCHSYASTRRRKPRCPKNLSHPVSWCDAIQYHAPDTMRRRAVVPSTRSCGSQRSPLPALAVSLLMTAIRASKTWSS